MIVTSVNLLCCLLGLLAGLWALYRDLGIFTSQTKTPVVEAWLVSMGTLAWAVALYSNIEGMANNSFYVESYIIGLSDAEALANVFMLIYWLGDMLKVQKYCLRLRKRRLQLLKRNKSHAKTQP